MRFNNYIDIDCDFYSYRGLWSSAIEQGSAGKKEVIFQARRVPVDSGTGFLR